MPLPEHIAQVVLDLSMREEFIELWKHFEKQADEMADQILDSSTDPVAREILVRVHEMFRHEVVDLPKRSVKELKK